MRQGSLIIVTHNFPPETVGGASRIYEICKMLKRNHNLIVLCPPPTFPFTNFPRFKRIIKFEKISRMKIVRVFTYQPNSLKPNLMERLLYYIVFPAICCLITFYLIFVRKIRYVLTSTPPLTTILPGLLCKSLGAKWILDVRDLWLYAAINLGYVRRDSFMLKLARKFETISFTKSDLVLVNSPTIGDYIKNDLPKTQWNKIFFIPFSTE
mgnify:CR=1 FL=1